MQNKSLYWASCQCTFLCMIYFSYNFLFFQSRILVYYNLQHYFSCMSVKCTNISFPFHVPIFDVTFSTLCEHSGSVFMSVLETDLQIVYRLLYSLLNSNSSPNIYLQKRNQQKWKTFRKLKLNKF